jgi:WD40 repeat protein
VRVPKNAGTGDARVTLSFEGWEAGAVAPAEASIQVIAVGQVHDSPQLRATLKGNGKVTYALAFAPDGKAFAVATLPDGAIRLCDPVTAQNKATLQERAGTVYSLAFTPDGKTVAVSCWKKAGNGAGGEVGLWDIATGKRCGSLSRDHGVSRLAVAPDGKWLAAAESWSPSKKQWKGEVVLWDLATNQARLTFPTFASSLAFSPDSKSLATYDNEAVREWDLSTGKERRALGRPGLTINSLAYSPDGRTLAGADFGGIVTLWDTPSGKIRATLRHEGGRHVQSVAFSPDGQTLAAGLGDRDIEVREPGEVVLWDVATGQQRLVLRGHREGVFGIAFSPDGRTLASGSGDGTVRLWDLSAR